MRSTWGRSGDDRLEQMIEMYSHGLTLEEVGREFNLTRERVRQILREAGVVLRSIGETAALRRDRLIRESERAVRQAFAVTRDIKLVARQLGLPVSVVRAIVMRNFSEAERRRPNRYTKKYSDAELLSFLRQASAELGGVLSGEAYNEFARGRRTSDGRPWPSKQAPFLRFGSWRKALQAAGLTANQSSPIAGQILFDEGHCVDAVRALARDLGKAPTAREYEEFAKRSNGGVPSLATVRNRCGGWFEVLQKAGL